jgi:hypothetical protein
VPGAEDRVLALARQTAKARAAQLYEEGITAGVRMTLDQFAKRFAPEDNIDLCVRRDDLLEFIEATRKRLPEEAGDEGQEQGGEG